MYITANVWEAPRLNYPGVRTLLTFDLGKCFRSAYFEKICLRSPACEKAWIFERAVGYLLQGYDDRVTSGVASRLDCMELCLIETEFPCASAEYDYTTRECTLSRHSRRTQPGAYRASTRDVDYIENQCVKAEVEDSCKYEVYENQDIGYADISVQSNSAAEVGDDGDDQYLCHFVGWPCGKFHLFFFLQ